MALSPKLPVVQMTQLFRAALEAAGMDADHFALAFAEWKESWPRWENSDPYFGKDGANFAPLRGQKMVIRHVHMLPEDPKTWPADVPPLTPQERAKILKEITSWNLALHNRRAARYRTSSRVLYYVDGGRHGYLLMYLAVEPDGHDAANKNKELLEAMADTAEAFQHDGSIFA